MPRRDGFKAVQTGRQWGGPPGDTLYVILGFFDDCTFADAGELAALLMLLEGRHRGINPDRNQRSFSVFVQWYPHAIEPPPFGEFSGIIGEIVHAILPAGNTRVVRV